MADLGTKIQNALDECRILVLGMQVLLGFELQAFLQPGFDRLPHAVQLAKGVALATMLVALATILAPAPFHRMARGDDEAPAMHRFTTAALSFALLPFAVSLAIDVHAALLRHAGSLGAAIGGAVVLLLAGLGWYGPALFGRSRREEDPMDRRVPQRDLGAEIGRVLTEVRVVLPGAQALLGFQLAGTLTDAFDRLPRISQTIHLVGLGLVALTTILLMFPAAWHRLAENGHESERFLRLASRTLVIALVPLGLGIACEVFVVARKLLGTDGAGWLGCGLTVALFVTAWLVVPMLARSRLEAHRQGAARTA